VKAAEAALLIVVSLAIGFALGGTARVQADPVPALDRQLVERITRALELQASETRDLVRATERCNR
jgi:hypothetical protein